MIKEVDNSKIFKITFGGWYQRTTLHLTEIFDLFSRGYSVLNLDKEQLSKFYKALNFENVSRETGYLEFVKARTKNGIEVRYYEDGLYILEMESDDIKKAQKTLEDYFDSVMTPAISYIFSLGAPTPKILANIKTAHPTVVSVTMDKPGNFEVDSKEFGKIYNKVISEDIMVYKTPDYIFVASRPEVKTITSDLVEMQIFFREFKDQLQKYLNIHRNIWEEISDIKERKSIKGTEVEKMRGYLDSYQKTISLINNRINQMGVYVRTRSSISKSMKVEEHLLSLFQYKFEVLTDTLDYIKEIWKMTLDYLNSAIQNIVEIKNQGPAIRLQSLQFITLIGVAATIFGLLAKNELPKVITRGVFYFGIILLTAIIINAIISVGYKSKKYKIKFGERIKNI